MYRYNRVAKVAAPPLTSTRLLDQVRERIRYLHYSQRTEKAYVFWLRSFIRWSGLRHPRDMGKPDVEAFLTMLANERLVSASTHKQALSAILFLYREVLGQELPWLNEIGRPAQRKRIPSVLTKDEITTVFTLMDGQEKLLAQLLYGTGMRLMEGLSLRVKDVDFDRRAIVVREGKGGKDRVVMLPRSIEAAMRGQLARSRALWDADRRRGVSGVEMPFALESKYPRAGESWAWHWVFPAAAHATGRSRLAMVIARRDAEEARRIAPLIEAVEARMRDGSLFS